MEILYDDLTAMDKFFLFFLSALNYRFEDRHEYIPA